MDWPTRGGSSWSSHSSRDGPFALEAHVDQYRVAVNAYNAALHDPIHVEIGFGFDLRHDGFRRVVQGGLKDRLQLRITFQIANETAIYHGTLNHVRWGANLMMSQAAERSERLARQGNKEELAIRA